MPPASLPALSQETGLTSYLEEIRQFPLLEVGEEFQLARRWRDEGDTEAAHRLVTSHLRLAAKMALGYPRLRTADGRRDIGRPISG